MENLEIKATLDNIHESVKSFRTNVEGRIDSLANNQSEMQQQLDAIDARGQQRIGGGGFETKSLAEEIFESEKLRNFAETGRGRVAISIPNFQQKTAITQTALGAYTSGVVMPERLPGIVPAALRTFRIRELMRRPPTQAGHIDFVKVLTYSQASPQVESSSKHEGTITFESVSEKVRTVAVWIPVSKQAISDLAALREAIDTHLIGGLLDEEDSQLLSGDATGENLNGLLTQATAFDTSLLVSGDGWEYADQVARSIQQLETAKQQATGVVLHPKQWWSIILSKDQNGQYIHGNPTEMRETRLWGRPVAVTTAISDGTYLVGDFVTGAAIHMRHDAIIEVSDSHEDYFARNMLAIRCEERLALCVYKPGAFVTGLFTQSPA